MRFLLITLIVLFIIYKLGGFIIRALLYTAAKQMDHHYRQQTGQPKKQHYSNGSVNVEYAPKQEKTRKKSFDGGEYVEFEEVK